MIAVTPVEEGSSQFKGNSLRIAHDEAELKMTTAIDIRRKYGKRLRAQAYERCNSKPNCLGWPPSDLLEKKQGHETRRGGMDENIHESEASLTRVAERYYCSHG